MSYTFYSKLNLNIRSAFYLAFWLLVYCAIATIFPFFAQITFAQDSSNPDVLSADSSTVYNAFVCTKVISTGKQTDEIINKIESAYSKLTSFKANFNQESYFLGLDRREQSNGLIYFIKPGKMHWHYQAPQEQKFISNGTIAWLYQPQMNQVTTMDFKHAFNSEMPVSFLLGIGTLRDTFVVKEACNTSHGIKILLTPKVSDQTIEQMHLLVDAKYFQPIGSRLENIGGNETSILFVNQDLKIQIPLEIFEFSIPKGVDIIDERDITGRNIKKSPIIETNIIE